MRYDGTFFERYSLRKAPHHERVTRGHAKGAAVPAPFAKEGGGMS